MPTECERSVAATTTQQQQQQQQQEQEQQLQQHQRLTATVAQQPPEEEQQENLEHYHDDYADDSAANLHTKMEGKDLNNGEMSTSQTSQTSTTSSNGHGGSSQSSSNGIGKKTSIISPDPTAYVAKARVTRPTPPPPSYNPMQFVQIKPCNLYQTAQEQLKKAEEVKKIKEIKKEEPEDWQNNLDNWKSSRRKRVEHIIDRVVEVKKLELEEHDRSRRKSKTFSEMIEERGERGGVRAKKLASLAVYNEDESNDFSDLGIGTSSASGKSSQSEDYDNNSVLSDNAELDKAIFERESHKPNSVTREYISSPGYDTSSSTAPGSSPDPCEYTYEGAIQDYKQRVSRATGAGVSAAYNKLTNAASNGKNSSPKESTPERANSSSTTNNGDTYPTRRGSKIEDRLIGFEVTSPSDSQEGVEKSKVVVPKIDISKRKEIFESANNETKTTTAAPSVPKVTLRDRFKPLEANTSANGNGEVQDSTLKREVKRLSGDITSIRDRMQSLEQQKQQNLVNAGSGSAKTATPKIVDIPVPPLKDRLSSLQNAVTKEEVKKPPVVLVDARQLEIMKSEEENAKQRIKQREQEPRKDTIIVQTVIAETVVCATKQPEADRDDSGIHTADDVESEMAEQELKLQKQQEQQLNAAIAALALEERQLEEAANAVNQIEEEFAQLAQAPAVEEAATTTTNEPPCEMEFSINEALELALEAIDKESRLKLTATTTKTTTTMTTLQEVYNNNNSNINNVKETPNKTDEEKELKSKQQQQNINNKITPHSENVEREREEEEELLREAIISQEPIYENISAASTPQVDAEAIIIPKTITTTNQHQNQNHNNNNNKINHQINDNIKQLNNKNMKNNNNNNKNNNNNQLSMATNHNNSNHSNINNNNSNNIDELINAFANANITSTLATTTTTTAANIHDNELASINHNNQNNNNNINTNINNNNNCNTTITAETLTTITNQTTTSSSAPLAPIEQQSQPSIDNNNTPPPPQQQQSDFNNINNNINNDIEPYYQVPKSSEPYYDAPKHLRPIPLYENIEIFYNGQENATLALNSIKMEPPKEKPPPPPIESPPPFDDVDSIGGNNTDTWSSDNTYETISTRLPQNALAGEHPSPPIKRMNSTKRIKKELRNKRSSFLGIETGGMDDEDSYLELTVAPPPDMAQLLQEERRLEKQLYLKAGLCDSSDTGESRDSGVSENHSRQSSEHYTNSSEENDRHLDTPPHSLKSNDLIYQNDSLLSAVQTPLLQTVKGNSAESWTESATVAAAATKSLTEATATANAKMLSIEEKIREQEEVLRVERELLQLEQEELKRQRENLMLRENMARRELQHGAKMLMSANRHSLQDLNGLSMGMNNALVYQAAMPPHHPLAQAPLPQAAPQVQPQQIYANIPNLQQQYYQMDTDYRKSMSDLQEFSKRLMVPPTPPTKPMRSMHVSTSVAVAAAAIPNGHVDDYQRHSYGGSLVKIATPTAAPRGHIYANHAGYQPQQHHQSAQNLSGSSNAVNAASSNHITNGHALPGNMSRNTLHALSATPKPKYTDGWVQVQNRKSYDSNLANDPAWLSAYQQKRKSMPEAYHAYNNHWLVQEAEQRRIADQQRRVVSNGNTPIHQQNGAKAMGNQNGNGKPLPDSIIQTLTERVQSKGIGDRKRFDNYQQVEKSPLHAASAYQQPQQQQPTPQQMSSRRSANDVHAAANAAISHMPPHVNVNTSPAHQMQTQSQTQPQQDKVLSVSGKKKCSHCGDELGRGAAMIIESLLLFYHINCFKCCVCHVQLGDGLNGTDVRVRNHKLHCQNCYSSDDGIKFSCV